MMAGLPAGRADNAGVCLALIAFATMSYSAWGTMMLTLPSDLFPASVVASVSGLSGTGAGLGGIAFTWATGQVVDRLSYEPMFVAAGLLPLVALVLVLVLIPRIRG
jgi:ACS family hexuronate transporter-like MFS transporter